MTRRWGWFDELNRLHEEMDRFFEQFFRPTSSGYRALPTRNQEYAITNYREPLADVWETDKEIIATVELPGVEKNDIDVTVTDQGIEVKVEKKDEKEEKKKGMYHLERSYMGFYRVIPLPEYAEKEKITATYKNGVLELRIPKREEVQQRGKKIKVE